MRNYKQLFIWENNLNERTLQRYKELLIKYFSNTRHLGRQLIDESDTAVDTREEINLMADSVQKSFIISGVYPVVYYSPPPAVGGIAGNIDMIDNLFNLYRFKIKPQEMLDFVDRAIGTYRSDRINAFIRTVSPLFWLFLFVQVIVSIPFMILGATGLNQEKIEGSFFGKLIKVILTTAGTIATICWTIIQIADKLGQTPEIKNIFGIR